MSTISFRNISKLIHPDTNPGVEDPGGKMVLAKKHRNSEKMLYFLGVAWGLIKDEGIQHFTTNDTKKKKLFRPIYVMTRKIYTECIGIKGQRVYFWYNDRKTFAYKKNVRFL